MRKLLEACLFSFILLGSSFLYAGVPHPIVKGTITALSGNTLTVKSGKTKYQLNNKVFKKDFSDIGCEYEFHLNKQTLLKKEPFIGNSKRKYVCAKSK